MNEKLTHSQWLDRIGADKATIVPVAALAKLGARAEAAEARALSLETRLAAMGEALGRTAHAFENFCNDVGNSTNSYARDMIEQARAILSTEASHER